MIQMSEKRDVTPETSSRPNEAGYGPPLVRHVFTREVAFIFNEMRPKLDQITFVMWRTAGDVRIFFRPPGEKFMY